MIHRHVRTDHRQHEEENVLDTLGFLTAPHPSSNSHAPIISTRFLSCSGCGCIDLSDLHQGISKNY